jgi:hypothetical protein
MKVLKGGHLLNEGPVIVVTEQVCDVRTCGSLMDVTLHAKQGFFTERSRRKP